jgi:glycosyltransferase involved in cell wall biosynthesis
MFIYALKRVGSILASKFVNRIHEHHAHIHDVNSPLAINLVTSWNKQCGIATYSAFLAAELKKKVKVYITSLPEKNAVNPYFMILGYRVGHSQDIVHVQFEYGLFPSLKLGKKNLTAFAGLLFYFGLAFGNRWVITTIHEPRKNITAGGRSGLFYTKLLDKLIFTVSDRIIVHTVESKELMETIYAVNKSKLRVIPHGSLEQPKFLNKDECKRKLNVQGKAVMTILGFVTPKKGHDLVIPLLPQIDPNVQLLIAGGPQTDADARYLEKLKKLAEQYQCVDRVTFTGYLEDLSPVLNATDIAVLPYRTVTDSGILHILVSYRVPTIASDLAAFKEIHQEYGCIELFKSEDAQDLLVKIQSLLSSQQRRESLKSRCEEMWNATKWSSIAQKHIEVYREVLSTRF